MVRIDIQSVDETWEVIAAGSVPDVIYLLVKNEETSTSPYLSLDILLQLYECAAFDVVTDEHPMVSHPTCEIYELDGSIVFDIFGTEFETTYEELETELERALGDVFLELNRRSSAATRQQAIDRISDHWVLIQDFEQTYKKINNNFTD